jgi:hypothetical protein
LSLLTAFNRALLACLPAMLAFAGACTKPNPDYCDKSRPCAPGKFCEVRTSTCLPPPDAFEAIIPDAAPDAVSDVPPDATPDVRPDVIDTRSPDAVDSCSRDEDCSASQPMCLQGVCRKCAGNEECGETKPVCGPAGRCVECLDSGSHCSGNKPLCGSAMTCLACTDDAACATRSATTPACAPGGACVECIDDKHCTTATRPICDTQAQKCVPCTADAQCTRKLGLDPGVCMSHEDGRCATVAETVFVQSVGGCSMMVGAGGTAAMPYCLAQDGITSAAAGGKPLVVMRGPMDRWSYAGSGKVSVVGQKGAKVVGAGVGVRVSGGELYLRGLTVSVSGATGTGVVAENGAILRMNRCLVENNGAGGIVVNGAGFDIVNTIIAGNDPGETTPGSGITFGGIYLAAAAGKPQRFVNDTVVGNKAIGLYCAGAYPVKGLLASGNSVSQVHTCVATSSNTVDAPQFDPARPYHLTAASPCTNMGDPTDFPPDDYDGDPRPQMSRSDCGADEFK